ncbi:hypothetical protein GCM10010404_87890 [Nonomuraea africana]
MANPERCGGWGSGCAGHRARGEEAGRALAGEPGAEVGSPDREAGGREAEAWSSDEGRDLGIQAGSGAGGWEAQVLQVFCRAVLPMRPLI